MAVHFSTKKLGLNIGQFRNAFSSLGHCLSIGFDPETGVFEFCYVFRV